MSSWSVLLEHAGAPCGGFWTHDQLESASAGYGGMRDGGDVVGVAVETCCGDVGVLDRVKVDGFDSESFAAREVECRALDQW